MYVHMTIEYIREAYNISRYIHTQYSVLSAELATLTELRLLNCPLVLIVIEVGRKPDGKWKFPPSRYIQ